MPRVFELTWDRRNRYWCKVIGGHKFYFGRGLTKADQPAYQAALDEYRRRLPSIRSGAAAQTPKVQTEGFRTVRAATNPKRRLQYAIRQYLEHTEQRAEEGDLSRNRAASVANSLRHFVEFAGANYPTAQIDESLIRQYAMEQRRLKTRDNPPPLSPHTIALRFAVLKLWLQYCWEHRLIRQLPRNMVTDLRAGSPAADSPDYFKWSVKGGKEVQRLIQACKREDLLYACVLLGLNTGAGLKDVMDIQAREYRWRSQEYLRLERRRSKSGQWGSYILWDETIRMLDKFRDPNATYNSSDLLLRRLSTGKPLADGYETKALGDVAYEFKKVVRELFGAKDKRSFKHLRKTGATYVGRREKGCDRLYLSHAATSQTDRFYTRVSYSSLDRCLCWMEQDFEVSSELIPRYKDPKERSYEERLREDEAEPDVDNLADQPRL